MTRLALVMVLALMLPGIAGAAEEQWCQQNAANCICSEQFLMTGFTVTSGAFYDPNDSTSSKQCTMEAAVANAAIVSNATISVTTDATALSALPSGHSVARFARVSDGSSMETGHGLGVATSFARIASRWYWWHSSNFSFKGEGSCTNSKFAHASSSSGQVWNIDLDSGSNIHFLNTLNQFTPNIDCCTGPVGGTGISYNAMRGAWWRFEVVQVHRETNTSPPHYDVIVYGQNITAGTPETVITQLSAGPGASALTPLSVPGSTTMNGFRGSGCAGWQGVSHYVSAAWTTNSGQRIGPAAEVEGGTNPTLNAPTGLRGCVGAGCVP